MQCAVFKNPQPGRDAHPYFVCLQSDFAHTVGSMVVAPLTPARTMPNASPRLFPEIQFRGEHYCVLIPQLAAVSPRIVCEQVGDLNAHRSELLAAIDLFFTGI